MSFEEVKRFLLLATLGTLSAWFLQNTVSTSRPILMGAIVRLSGPIGIVITS